MLYEKKREKKKPSNNIPWDEAYLLLQLSLLLVGGCVRAAKDGSYWRGVDPQGNALDSLFASPLTMWGDGAAIDAFSSHPQQTGGKGLVRPPDSSGPLRLFFTLFHGRKLNPPHYAFISMKLRLIDFFGGKHQMKHP